MRETRHAQISIFHFYAPHALGDQLSNLSDLLDDHPLILDCIERDFRVPDTAATSANGLSVDSVFRCLLLKQILKVSCEKTLIPPVRLAHVSQVCPTTRGSISQSFRSSIHHPSHKPRDARAG